MGIHLAKLTSKLNTLRGSHPLPIRSSLPHLPPRRRLQLPSESFLITAANLQPDEFAKLTKLLDYSCEHGLPKNKQKVNTLGDGLFEFKTTGGLRLIGFWDANRIILCTNGFLKKRQTTPPGELTTATKWKKAYETARKANKLKFSE